MDQLAVRLKDVKEAGLYMVTCELDDVRAAASEAGLVLFDVDLTGVHSKSEFLQRSHKKSRRQNGLVKTGMRWQMLFRICRGKMHRDMYCCWCTVTRISTCWETIMMWLETYLRPQSTTGNHKASHSGCFPANFP